MHLYDKFGMSDATQQLERALETALSQYAETMGEAFPITPILDVVADPELWAMAELDDDIFCIQVSTEMADSTAKLWISAFDDEGFVASFGQTVGTDAENMTHISLVWLMLHEMHHFQMGHFDSRPKSNLPMIGSNKEHGLVKRTAKHSRTHPSACAASSLIFEMQADHDATEMLLDAYSPDEWLSLRVRVAAISAVIMLIECADSSNQSHGATHPKVATRIFQLLGHVVDMPMISTLSELNQRLADQANTEKLLVTEERERFVIKVVLPAFFDAVSLARIANARSVAEDLGNITDFFNDVAAVKLEHCAVPNELTTVGAQQWAELATKS